MKRSTPPPPIRMRGPQMYPLARSSKRQLRSRIECTYPLQIYLTFSHRYLFSRLLSEKYASKVSSVRHQVDALELRNTISRNLAEFRRSQRIFMPALGPILDDACDDEPTEDSFKLFLPSELSVDDRAAWCPPDTPALELRFRYAQADDSLAEIRRLLRLNRNLRDENSKHLHHGPEVSHAHQGTVRKLPDQGPPLCRPLFPRPQRNAFPGPTSTAQPRVDGTVPGTEWERHPWSRP